MDSAVGEMGVEFVAVAQAVIDARAAGDAHEAVRATALMSQWATFELARAVVHGEGNGSSGVDAPTAGSGMPPIATMGARFALSGVDTSRPWWDIPDPLERFMTKDVATRATRVILELMEAREALFNHILSQQRPATGQPLTQYNIMEFVFVAMALCELGHHIRFYTATILQEKQERETLTSFMTSLWRVELLVLDEVGFITLHKGAFAV